MPIAPLTSVLADRRGLNIDDAVTFYERVYDSHDIHIGEAAPDGFHWRYRTVGDADVVVATSAVAARRWGTINPGSGYVLAWANSPGIVLDTGSPSPLPMKPGIPVMYPVGREFTFDALPTTQHLIRFDGSFLEAVAAAHRDDIPTQLVLTRTPDTERLLRLRGVVQDAAAVLLDVATDAATRTLVNTRVAEAVVDAFDVTPASGLQLQAGAGTVRSAQEWIVAHARDPLVVTDVSRAVGISARTLQASFAREIGMSPLRFLREVRVHRVRAELLRSDRDATTVAAVAARWGFAHMGRFAGYYADTFGESPSETLRQHPSR